jgi:hypothetical protein
MRKTEMRLVHFKDQLKSSENEMWKMIFNKYEKKQNLNDIEDRVYVDMFNTYNVLVSLVKRGFCSKKRVREIMRYSAILDEMAYDRFDELWEDESAEN